MSNIDRQLHLLEQEFGLPASDILDTINRRNRCKIAVRGAIAETHLLIYLTDLKVAGTITDFEDFDIDGYPDVRVDFGNRSFLLECKNVEKEKVRQSTQPGGSPITIDFQRTRNHKNNPAARFYAPSEFEILAACLWNRTHVWEFRFTSTRLLPTHKDYPERLSSHVTVLPDFDPDTVWFKNLDDLLRTL